MTYVEFAIRNAGGLLKREIGHTSTALSMSAFPPFELVMPSTVAATISATYLVSVRPSISFIKASADEVRMAERNLLIRVVCFFNDASRGPFGSKTRERRAVQHVDS